MECPQRSAEDRETALGGQLVEPLLHHVAHVRVELIDVGMLTELCDDVLISFRLPLTPARSQTWVARAGWNARCRGRIRSCIAPLRSLRPKASKRAKLASACGALHAWRVVGGPQPLPAIWGKHPAASIPIFVDDEYTAPIDRVLSDVTEVIGFPPGGWLLAAFFDWATRIDGKCHGWSLP